MNHLVRKNSCCQNFSSNHHVGIVETIFEAILHLILCFFAGFLSQYTAIWHLLLYFMVNFFARLVLLCFLGFCCYPSSILLFLVSRCHFFSVWVNETPPESCCWFIFHSLAKFSDFASNEKTLVQKYHLLLSRALKRLQQIKLYAFHSYLLHTQVLVHFSFAIFQYVVPSLKVCNPK